MLSCLACTWWRADAQAVQHIGRERSKDDEVLTAADHVVLRVCYKIVNELVQEQLQPSFGTQPRHRWRQVTRDHLASTGHMLPGAAGSETAFRICFSDTPSCAAWQVSITNLGSITISSCIGCLLASRKAMLETGSQSLPACLLLLL